ncbi:MAG: zinc-ribbon domain-containing protein [Chloroflexota bacterium]|nr:MAG: zinc-ribbon domain-containing protein [Chloroflexota bacterium]
MPFCTECGARHDDSAKVCPSCGQTISAPPLDEDLDDLLASLDADVEGIAATPTFGDTATHSHAIEPTPDYLEQIQDVRAAIAAQSGALQDLDDLSWDNTIASSIRDELNEALRHLRDLIPPEELAEPHRDFVVGTEKLVHGFVALIEALSAGQSGAPVDAAQGEIVEANDHFHRGTEALNAYLGIDAPETNVAVLGGADAEDDLGLDDLDFDFKDEPAAANTPPAAADSDDAALRVIEAVELDTDEPEPVDSLDDLPDLPDDLASLDDDPSAGTMESPFSGLGGPTFPPSMPVAEAAVPAREPIASAWPSLGDAATDAVLLEIEGGWIRGRPNVYDAIERSIRAAVVDALRAAMETRQRVEDEANGEIRRISLERKRLLDEVESLRRENHGLQVERGELRRSLNELERERQSASNRRQQMFQDTETQRSQLLGEIEQLGGQLEAMRKNIEGLLNLSGVAARQGGGTTSPPSTTLRTAAQVSTPTPPTAMAPDDTTVSEIRIGGIAADDRAAIEFAIEMIDGVALEEPAKDDNGTLVIRLRHAAGVDLIDPLLSLPGPELNYVGAPRDGVLEFAVA